VRRSSGVRQDDRGDDCEQPGGARAPAPALPSVGAVRCGVRLALSVPGHLRHGFRQVHTEDAVALFSATGITTVFTNLEGFPEDWKENSAAFVKFVREHHYPSFLEYGEYPYATADEIKKALRLKAAFSTMLDQMQ